MILPLYPQNPAKVERNNCWLQLYEGRDDICSGMRMTSGWIIAYACVVSISHKQVKSCMDLWLVV